MIKIKYSNHSAQNRPYLLLKEEWKEKVTAVAHFVIRQSYTLPKTTSVKSIHLLVIRVSK